MFLKHFESENFIVEHDLVFFYHYSICVSQSLKALGSYQLMLGVARQLADSHNCVTALCQSASILLDLGAPEPAMVFVVIYGKRVSPQDFSFT